MSSRSLRLAHHVEHVFGGDRVRRRDEIAEEAEFGAGLHLALHVDLRGRHMAHQHRGQPRPHSLRGQPPDLFRNFLLDCAAIAAPSRTLGMMRSKDSS